MASSFEGRRFEGRSGILTGGAKGIGRATALRFLREGGKLAVFDREPEDSEFATSLRAEAAADGNRLLYLVTDVTDDDSVAASVARAAAEFGPAEILVNNVGFGANPKPIDTIPRREWDDFITINLASVFVVSRAVVPAMRKAGYGRIVNLASVAGRFVSDTSAVHYSASKGAIMSFTRKLAFEEAPHGIAVNAVAPGTVFTDRVRLRHEARSPEVQQAKMKSIALGRAARPEEIAAVILFLASDDASYVTGVVWDVNGGKFMG